MVQKPLSIFFNFNNYGKISNRIQNYIFLINIYEIYIYIYMKYDLKHIKKMPTLSANLTNMAFYEIHIS